MYQVVILTDEEKLQMYKRLKKEDLCKMLIEADKVIDRLTNPSNYYFDGADKPLNKTT